MSFCLAMRGGESEARWGGRFIENCGVGLRPGGCVRGPGLILASSWLFQTHLLDNVLGACVELEVKSKKEHNQASRIPECPPGPNNWNILLEVRGNCSELLIPFERPKCSPSLKYRGF